MTGIVPPGQGHLLTARGNVMAFKAVADQTGGDFSLMERTVPPGARTPPPHRTGADEQVRDGAGLAGACECQCRDVGWGTMPTTAATELSPDNLEHYRRELTGYC